MLYDVFLSHASEDKDAIVRPLVRALAAADIAVWYDESELRPGDSLRQAIDHGLSKSRYGVIILSQAFFAKRWPQWELNGLAARQMSGQERVIIPVWHGVDKEDVLDFSPPLADLVAVSTKRGITAVCQAISRVVRPQESPLVVARGELIAYGHTPPVISDEWWLDVVEASNRMLNAGAFIPESSQWGRWSFPLPNEGARGEDRGVRLAWAAMQLHWVREADERKISQITPPPLALQFIRTMPGLAETCREFPKWLAAYMPQLTIPGLGGEFEVFFDEERAESPSSLDELMFRLPPERLDPAGAAGQFVKGALWGPSPKCYETFDYLIWLLSDDSQWLPEPYRLLLQQGMREWPVWLPPSRPDRHDDQEQSCEWIRDIDAESAFPLPPDVVAHLRREVAFSANQLSLTDAVETLLERFLSGQFLEGYIRNRNGGQRRRRRMGRSQDQTLPQNAMLDRTAIYCADVGSVAARRFGWASIGPDGTHGGTDMQQLATAVAESLRSGRSVALGFECPLFVPLAHEPDALTTSREGEGNRAWCAGAGAGALTTGLVQVVWILREIRRMTPVGCNATLDWDEFSQGRASLFLWEAFVSAASKRHNHVADAQAAAEAFKTALSEPTPTSAITAGPETYSLIGAALLRSGWSGDQSLLQRGCLVVRATPNTGRPSVVD
jgi:hypothetical protein